MGNPQMTAKPGTNPGIVKIKRAVISVSDKAGIDDFARKLHSHGVEILSTGGTADRLKKAGKGPPAAAKP